MRKTIFVFSSLIVALLALFRLSKYSFLSGSTSVEIVLVLIAVVFLLIRLWLNPKKPTKDTVPIPGIDHTKIEELGISKREYQVLLEISKGRSNKEIADALFVSESTIKTHVSNLLLKLDAKRRTQAVQNARKLNIIEA